jgi:hypothetical protein
MVIGAAIWLGKAMPLLYMRAITSFIVSNHSMQNGLKLNIYYSKTLYNLPEQFEDHFKTYMASSLKTIWEECQERRYDKVGEGEPDDLPDEILKNKLLKDNLSATEIIEFIHFINIDQQSTLGSEYCAWLEKTFSPTPFNYISDYLRFAILADLSDEKHINDTVIYFELDVLFKKGFSGFIDANDAGKIILHASKESVKDSYHIVYMHAPNSHCYNLFKAINESYNAFYLKTKGDLNSSALAVENIAHHFFINGQSVPGDILKESDDVELNNFDRYVTHYDSGTPEELIDISHKRKRRELSDEGGKGEIGFFDKKNKHSPSLENAAEQNDLIFQ